MVLVELCSLACDILYMFILYSWIPAVCLVHFAAPDEVASFCAVKSLVIACVVVECCDTQVQHEDPLYP